MPSRHTATITWARNAATFTDNRYSRAHGWAFDGGATVAASSSPHSVRLPFSDPAAVDPEEAFVAALSSCHMLWFLSLAAQAGFVVDHYSDNANGALAPDAQGRMAITTVTLNPDVAFSGALVPDDAAVAALHHRAHEACYLASSVRSEIVMAGTWRHVPTER